MLLRGVLRVAETPYRLAVGWRNRRYDRGSAEMHRVEARVVSVGNLTLGGTGKTPLVEWLVRWFADRGRRVAIVSRGYKAAEDGANDEARELAERLPGVPHVQDADRVAAARQACREPGADVIVLDDGFQHRRLARDLDIVLIDATEPFGYGHVFPRGMLREPVSSLARADVIVLSRADMLEPSERIAICNELAPFMERAVWVEMAHAPKRLRAANEEGAAEEAPLELLRGKRVAAFCGLGNPAGFRHTLEECGYEVEGWRELPDHYHYDSADIEALAAWAQGIEPPVEALVCTHKDLVKIGRRRMGALPVWAVSVGVKLLAGEEALEAKLSSLLRE